MYTYIFLPIERERERYTLSHWHLRSKDDHYLIRFHFLPRSSTWKHHQWNNTQTTHQAHWLACVSSKHSQKLFEAMINVASVQSSAPKSQTTGPTRWMNSSTTWMVSSTTCSQEMMHVFEANTLSNFPHYVFFRVQIFHSQCFLKASFGTVCTFDREFAKARSSKWWTLTIQVK